MYLTRDFLTHAGRLLRLQLRPHAVQQACARQVPIPMGLDRSTHALRRCRKLHPQISGRLPACEPLYARERDIGCVRTHLRSNDLKLILYVCVRVPDSGFLCVVHRQHCSKQPQLKLGHGAGTLRARKAFLFRRQSDLTSRFFAKQFHQVVRAMTPLFTIGISVIFLHKRHTRRTYLSLIPVVMGVAFATYGDYYVCAFCPCSF